MKRILLHIYLLVFPLCGYSQLDTTVQSNNGNVVIKDFQRIEHDDYGFDSLGNKQGEWYENWFDYPFYNSGNVKILPNVKALGFYINNHKQGTWEVFDIAAGEEYSYDYLIAHCFFIKDSLIYTIYYDRKRICSIVRESVHHRPNNLGYLSVIKLDELILFDKKGRIKERQYYAPDGIFDQVSY